MILLTGNGGMLGREIAALLQKEGIPFEGAGRELDITHKEALIEAARNKRFIVNCAAYTAVDRAESDAAACARVNTDGARNAADAAQEAGATLVHFSTDYVFSGNARTPYTENEETAPAGVYGRTKRDGEECIKNICTKQYIIRTSWLYGSGGKNFVKTMLGLMRDKKSVSVVNDQWGCPTWTASLAEAVLALIKSEDAPPYGVYHYAGSGICTWYEFACAIYEYGREAGLLREDCAILPCSSAAYKTAAARPSYSALDTEKIRRTLGIEIPRWQESLKRFLSGDGVL